MIAVTGATGKTGSRVAENLLAKGEKVRAIGRNAEKLASLVERGAEPFVGEIGDASWLTTAFTGAAAAYLVLPEDMSQPDLRAHQEQISDSCAVAITNAHVPFVVNLSSIGAQHARGSGPIVGLHNQEQKLNRINGLNVLHIRAAYFMENLFRNLSPLRAMGTLPGGMRGDMPISWIATQDLAAYAATRLASRDFVGRSIQELHGQRDLSMSEAASIVGKAIGRPDTTCVELPGPKLETALLKMGLSKKNVRTDSRNVGWRKLRPYHARGTTVGSKLDTNNTRDVCQ